jgi:hypothetical protein
MGKQDIKVLPARGMVLQCFLDGLTNFIEDLNTGNMERGNQCSKRQAQ